MAGRAIDGLRLAKAINVALMVLAAFRSTSGAGGSCRPASAARGGPRAADAVAELHRDADDRERVPPRVRASRASRSRWRSSGRRFSASRWRWARSASRSRYGLRASCSLASTSSRWPSSSRSTCVRPSAGAASGYVGAAIVTLLADGAGGARTRRSATCCYSRCEAGLETLLGPCGGVLEAEYDLAERVGVDPRSPRGTGAVGGADPIERARSSSSVAPCVAGRAPRRSGHSWL